jgi:integrase
LLCAILTAARSGEVRGMTWREVDIEAGVWTIPGSRMKAGREHRVPLSPAAIDVLWDQLPERGKPDPDALVFPGQREGRPLSDMTLGVLVRGMATDGLKPGEAPRWCDASGAVVVPHGFRSSFRDWAAEATAHPREVVEMALAHSIESKVEAAYRRGDLFEKRRQLMEDWAVFCNIRQKTES